MGSLPPAIIFINGDINYPAVPPPTPPTYIGADASMDELTGLQQQLFINDTMTKAEFDARLVADPNYSVIVHLQGLRILVILPTFQDYLNRQYADVVIFLHQGLADVECNRLAWPGTGYPDADDLSHTYPPPPQVSYPHNHHHGIAGGPPGQSWDKQRLNIYELLRAAGSHDVVTLPFDAMPHCGSCNYPFYCDRCHTFSGIKICGKCGCNSMCGCGIIDNQGIMSSPVHAPNCDNEYHNRDFIDRK